VVENLKGTNLESLVAVFVDAIYSNPGLAVTGPCGVAIMFVMVFAPLLNFGKSVLP
jgi:hypothetical protein